MRPETIATITKLLNREVNEKRDAVLHCIENGFDKYLDERVKEYQSIFLARGDFENWLDEQEEDDG